MKHEYKIIFLGDSGVGKTSIITRYVTGKFSQYIDPTIGASFICSKKEMETGDLVRFHIWDTAGQERFRSIINVYYRAANAAVIVCDINNYRSVDSLEYWINQIQENRVNSSVKLFLVANKLDLLASTIGQERPVHEKYTEELNSLYPRKLLELSKKFKIPLIACSASDNHNILQLFESIFQEIREFEPLLLEPSVSLVPGPSFGQRVLNLLHSFGRDRCSRG